MACRIAIVIAPLALVPIISGASATNCACLAVALFAVAAYLRWRSQLGRDAVWDGLIMGTVPLLTALLLRSCGANCGPLGTFSEAELACVLAGAVAGAGVTLRAAELPAHRAERWLLSVLVASVTAALGCVGLGLGGVLATLGAITVAGAASWIPVRLRTT